MTFESWCVQQPQPLMIYSVLKLSSKLILDYSWCSNVDLFYLVT